MKDIPLVVSNCYACALIGRKRAKIYSFSRLPTSHQFSHRWNRRNGYFQDPETTKWPQIHSGLWYRIFLGTECKRLVGLPRPRGGHVLSHIAVPGPFRCHLPTRTWQERIVLMIWNVWISCRDNGKADIFASCSSVAIEIWSWGISDIMRGRWKGESWNIQVPGWWSIWDVITSRYNLSISGGFSLTFFFFLEMSLVLFVTQGLRMLFTWVFKAL